MTEAAIKETLTQARWILQDLDTDGETLIYSRAERVRLDQAPFHDGRSPFSASPEIRRIRLSDALAFDNAEGGDEDFRLVLHSSFCGSSYLARILDVPGYSFAFREPNILNVLSNRLVQGEDAAPFGDHGVARVMRFALRQCHRPFASGERLLVKPSNWANPVLASHGLPDTASIVLLEGDLEAYLVANLRGGQARMRYTLDLLNQLARHAPERNGLIQSTAASAAGMRRMMRLIACVHYLQIDRFCAIARTHRGAIRRMTSQELFADPQGQARAASRALGLNLPEDALAKSLRAASGKHVKTGDAVRYDPGAEANWNAGVRARYKGEISETLAWARDFLEGAIAESSANAPQMPTRRHG